MALLSNDYVIFALIALTIFTVYMSLIAAFRKDPMRERLRKVLPAELPEAQQGFEPEDRSALASLCVNLLAMTGTDMAQARREHYMELARAGITRQDGVAYYLAFKRFIQPVFLVIAAVLLWQGIVQPTLVPKLILFILALLCLVIGLRGAALYLKNKTQKRQALLQATFADALDLLLVCVESGLPLDTAITRVTRELKDTHPVITAELDRTRVELNVLSDRVQALNNLAERTDTQGFRSLVASLIQTEKFGTSIADTLRTLADEFRITRMLDAENRAARIPVLITLPLIIFILLPFLASIIAPAIIRINMQGGL